MMKELLIAAEGLLPNKIRHAGLVWRRSPHWNRVGVIFVHIPKSAGSSVSSALYGRFMGHSTADEIRSFAPRTYRKLPSFAITRNPWDRCVSAYRFAIAGAGQGEGIKAAIQNPNQYRIREFSSFDRFIEEWLTKKEIDKIDPVFRPQHLFVCDKESNLLVSWSEKLENMLTVESNLSDLLGRTVKFPRLNRSGPEVAYRNYYNPRLIQLVGDLYKNDIELFGYDF